jgi:hypothetical protein
MLNLGPKTAQSPNPSQAVPLSLFRIAIDSVFNGVGVALRNLIDGIKTEVAQHNSLQVLVNCAAYFKPELSEVQLNAVLPMITDKIKNAKVAVVEVLKNQDFLLEIERRMAAVPAQFGEQLNIELQSQFPSLIQEISPYQHLVQMVIPKAGELNASLAIPFMQLLTTIFETSEVNTLLKAMNIEENIVATQKDKQAMQGLNRLCYAVNGRMKSIMNDPASVNFLIARMHLWSGYSQIVIEPIKDDLNKTSEIYGKFFFEQLNKTNLGVLNRLKPISDMQSKLFNDFVNSALYQAILQEKRLCVALDTQFAIFKGTALYEAFKASSQEMAACLTKIELEVAAGTLKPVIAQIQRPAALGTSPSPIMAGFRRRAANDVVEVSSEEEMKETSKSKVSEKKRRKK